MSEQVFKRFGHCQNHQNQTLKWLYLPKKSKYENSFFIKRNTILLLYMYQVFILLLGHLPFFLLFFFTFMENFFLRQSLSLTKKDTTQEQIPSVSVMQAVVNTYKPYNRCLCSLLSCCGNNEWWKRIILSRFRKDLFTLELYNNQKVTGKQSE